MVERDEASADVDEEEVDENTCIPARKRKCEQKWIEEVQSKKTLDLYACSSEEAVEGREVWPSKIPVALEYLWIYFLNVLCFNATSCHSVLVMITRT